MLTRAFIAIELPARVQSAIAQVVQPLQRMFPKPRIRWVAAGNVHLTLKFLGEVPGGDIDRLSAALSPSLHPLSPFPISFAGLGAFPTPRRARVLWIGLNAPPLLGELVETIESIAVREGFEPEPRPFSPHLTVGRVSQDFSMDDHSRLSRELDASRVGTLGSMVVEAVIIYKSELKPGGSIYTPLHTLPLKSI